MPTPHAASFRDPSGFVFTGAEGTLLRQINRRYEPNYRALMQSCLYEQLVDAGLLISHEVVSLEHRATDDAAAIIKPERVRWVTYPYEWCFSQLKDAALATLEIQKLAMERGLSLKDASAYNIQSHKGKLLLIDTLSFEVYEPSSPWVAYRQFCQHFLAPLALMSLVDVRLGQLTKVHIDGVPLDLAASLLPWKTHVSALQIHIHMHAKSQREAGGKAIARPQGGFSKQALLGIIDSLESTVKGLKWEPAGTEWADYYQETNYSDSAMNAKRELVREFIQVAAPTSVWDLGANTGEFSRVASSLGVPVVAWDIDPAAVERNYLETKGSGDALVVPLLQDLTNPSPGIGWCNEERESLIQRGPVDMLMALALIHHLAIGNNVPLDRIAEFFARTAGLAIVEFVPKGDSQVQRMLASREDIFDGYDAKAFEAAMSKRFDIVSAKPVAGSERTLYLFRRRS